MPTIDYKLLKSDDIKFSGVSQHNPIYVNDTNTLTSQVAFARGIHKDYGSSEYPASALFYYLGKIKDTATGSATALYEFVRGFLYRDDSDPSVSSITSIIQSKTSASALTGFRMIMFDKNLRDDKIRPTSFRLSISPYKTTSTKPSALFLSNSAITDNATTGSFAQISGRDSLTGSLMTGVAGSVLSGFTVRMKVKLRPSGPPVQTLFHRRLGDFSLSALDHTLNQFGQSFDNSIVLWKYGSMNSLFTYNLINTINFGNVTTYDWNNTAGYKNSFTASFQDPYNVGGGQVFYSLSTNTTSPIQWLSLCSSITSNVIKSINNWIVNGSTITAYVNNSVTSLFLYGTTHTSNIVIYNEPTNLQKSHNLPLAIICSINAYLE